MSDAAGVGSRGALPSSFRRSGSSSFTDFVGEQAPHLLATGRQLPPGMSMPVPHATTIVALSFDGGVVMAGDRRATMGNIIANREMDKVFAADEYSVVGIAGTAGLAVELVRLYQVELEHYEKIEGTIMSLDGKANRLASMIRANLAMAMQGLSVMPLFAGFDAGSGVGRIFSYDVTGGCYPERDHHSIGSGSLFARGALKKLWSSGLDEAAAVSVAIESLFDAAEDDSATGGPDVTRAIWPTVAIVDVSGVRFVDDDTLHASVTSMVASRQGQAGGLR